MRLEYVISLDDFRSVQAPFAAKPGRNVGFRAVLVVCASMALLGLGCAVQGMGVGLGLFLIGLGAVSGLAAYFFDRRSIEKARRKYDDAITAGYGQIHCRDQRVLEFDENSFTLSCRCGSVTRPWSELTSFSENKPFAIIRTRMEQVPITKAAFPSEGALTEFRALVLGKLNGAKPYAVRPIDFRYVRADFRSAYLLNLVQAGGWRGLLRLFFSTVGFGYIILLVLRAQGPHDAAAPYFAFGTIGLFVLVGSLMKRKRHYEGALRLTFGEDGLHLQDPQTVAVTNWNRYLGFLESREVFLIYSNPRLYRIVPKRILGEREKEFAKLLHGKLPRYDYKRPVSPLKARAASITN